MAADVNGSGKDVVADSPLWTPPQELNGSGSDVGAYGSDTAAATSLIDVENNGQQRLRHEPAAPTRPIGFASLGAFGKLTEGSTSSSPRWGPPRWPASSSPT